MILEIFGLYALAIFAVLLYAETGKRNEVGVVAGLLLLVLAVSVATDGVQIPNGQSVNTSSLFNSSNNQTIMNTTTTTNYAELSVPYIEFNTIFALVAVLLAMYIVLSYGLGMGGVT